MPVLIVVGVLLIIVIWVISVYNGLVKLRNRRQNAFADIDVQLRQRHDLVPQIVDTVKGYATHERELLTRITEARSAAISAQSIEDKIATEKQLTSALQGLKIAVEAYPDLKANQNFLQLQGELSDIENKLAAARRFFNNAVQEYNTGIQQFPAVLLAGALGFTPKTFFDVGEERATLDKAPQVKF